MGIRGGPHPHERICIGSMLGDVLADSGARLAEYADLEPFQVPTWDDICRRIKAAGELL
jgi:hypothetical protein